MKSKNKFVLLSGLAIAILYQTGCASFLSYQSSKNDIIKARTYASSDEKAIKAYNIGGPEAVAMAFDISALDVIVAHPFRQLGAAVLDAGIGYGIYWGVDQLVQKSNDDNGDQSNNTITSGGDTFIISTDISGNDNTTTTQVKPYIQQPTTSTTTQNN